MRKYNHNADNILEAAGFNSLNELVGSLKSGSIEEIRHAAAVLYVLFFNKRGHIAGFSPESYLLVASANVEKPSEFAEYLENNFLNKLSKEEIQRFVDLIFEEASILSQVDDFLVSQQKVIGRG